MFVYVARVFELHVKMYCTIKNYSRKTIATFTNTDQPGSLPVPRRVNLALLRLLPNKDDPFERTICYPTSTIWKHIKNSTIINRFLCLNAIPIQPGVISYNYDLCRGIRENQFLVGALISEPSPTTP